MVNFVQGDVRVNGVKLHYYRTGGNKPPFVLLHGATDNGLCWTALAEVLSEKYDVVMPDAQGHGQSDRLGPAFQFSDLTVQVAGLIRQLGLESPIVMGHSMGAGTTVNLAVEYADLPRAIVLEDPGWNSQDAFKSLSPEEKAKQREMFAKFLGGFGKRTREELIDECRKANPNWSEVEIIPWAESKLQFDPAMFSKIQIDRPSYVELVPRIRCPALLLAAENGVVSEKTAEQAARLWKGSKPLQYVRIMGAGHNIRRDQFKQLCEAISNFVKGL
jgi:N-formylmaleamate deformylase